MDEVEYYNKLKDRATRYRAIAAQREALARASAYIGDMESYTLHRDNAESLRHAAEYCDEIIAEHASTVSE